MRKTLLLLLFCVLLSLPALARDFEYTYEGQTITYTVIDEKDRTCMTKAGSLKDNTVYGAHAISGALILPAQPKDVNITYRLISIGEESFASCSELTSVQIPNSVTSFGEYAFAFCSGLRTLDIPMSVTSIRMGVFYGCTGLTSVDIPTSVSELGYGAFSGCENLKSLGFYARNCKMIGTRYYVPFPNGLETVIIGDEVTRIPEDIFYYCIGLTSVEIPNSVVSIGSCAFYGCSRLTSEVIPNSVTSIGEDAFYDCNGLIKSAYPSSLKKNPFPKGKAIVYNPKGAIIEDGLIWGSDKSAIYFVPLSLEGEFSIPETVTSIDEYAFYGCSGLTSVMIPNSVTSIGSDAFSGCNGLIKSAYPNNLKNPFYNGIAVAYDPEGDIVEDGLVWGPEKSAIYFAPLSLDGEFRIPETVTSIGNYAFEGCSGLSTVKCEATEPAAMNDDAFKGLYDTTVLCVPDEAVGNYLATNWSLFKNIRTKTGVELGYYSDGVLEYRLNPTDMTATIIGAKSYSNLQIPERFTDDSDAANPVRYYVKGIGYKAFDGKGVKEVAFNSRSQMEIIGDYAFKGSEIASINLPSTLTSIGDHTFESSSNLKSISVPGSVKAIGEAVFKGCSNLSEVELSAGLEQIKATAFESTKIGSISIPSTVKAIGENAFYDTRYLKNIILNEGLTSIGAGAFASSRLRDDNSTSLFIPSSLSSIGEDAFANYDCGKVEVADLTAWCGIDFDNEKANPLSVCGILSINEEEVTDLTIPEDVERIKPYAFYNLKSLKNVSIPASVVEIGDCAFDNCNGLKDLVIPAGMLRIGYKAIPATNVTFADGTSAIEIDDDSFYNGVRNLYWGRPIESLTFSLPILSTLGIGGAVSEIPEGRFKNCDILSLTIGNEVETIGVNAFSGCWILADVKFGSSIVAIEDGAFRGCSGLTEVILSPSVETIGASAFAGNSKLASIIMGHNVKTIGEKAFDGCPASTVSITALTPPKAPNNTFSNYSGKLYLQGQAAVDAYYDAYTCWDRFSSYVMIEPEGIELDGDDKISGKPGDTFQLKATLWPENVTLPQIFWCSTNSEIATVDANGLVTLHIDMEEVLTRSAEEGNSCKIIAESLYADGPLREVSVFVEGTGVDEIYTESYGNAIDYTQPYEVYNLNGVKVADSKDDLAKGIYIVRQGNAAVKISVK